MEQKTQGQLAEEAYHFLEKGAYEQAERAALLLRDMTKHAAEALALLSSIYIEAGKAEQAEAVTEELYRLQPQDAYTLFLRARAAFMQGRRSSLIDDLQYALRHGRNMQDAYRERIYNLLGQCFRHVGNSRQSADAYLKASRLAESPELRISEYSNYLFNLHYRTDLSLAENYEAHVRYNRFFTDVPKFRHRWGAAGKKLRIGYISPDFRNHVVMRFSYALLRDYDHEEFSVYCYAKCTEDAISNEAKKLVDGWRNIQALTAEEAARCIYEDGIDILFDLSGHTNHGCLPILAYKPAPIQISGIGYFATTGLKAIDYFLGDFYLDGGGHSYITESSYFTEHLLLMPHSHFCYTPLCDVPKPQGTSCRQRGYVTFGSFNNFTKVTDEVLRVWQKIFMRVPEAHFLLKASLFNQEEGCKATRERLEKFGFDLTRVELRAFSADYLADYYDMDIALDTFPYPGGGTTCDALYMGVPVITLAGSAHGARFGYSILMNAGLEELCAVSEEAYIEKAVALASGPDVLDALHLNLRTMVEHSLLMNGKLYLQDLEKSYHMIWRKFCQEQKSPSYREISQLLPQMKQLFQKHDQRQALALADAIAAAGSADKHVLEELAVVYIDAKEVKSARKMVECLQHTTGDYGFGLFLQSRVEVMEEDWAAAKKHSQQALESPDLSLWQRSAVHNLLALIYKAGGEACEMIESYRMAMEQAEDPSSKALNYSNYLFSLHYSKRSPEFMYATACGYNALFETIQPYVHMRSRRHDKLRIGYISPDLCRHVVSLFSFAFFESYDHDRFEVTCYANCSEDVVSRRIMGFVDHWCNIYGMSAQEAAQCIYKDEIDILFDLAGHTKNNCLPVLAYKPAPIQISGIGYFATTGLKTVDYFLSDRYLAASPGQSSHMLSESVVKIPDSSQADPYFCEQLLVMPHSHFCYRPVDEAPRPGKLPCKSNGYITFGSFNNFAKVTDDLLQLWAEILHKVQDSHLFLKAGVFNHAYGRQKSLERMRQAGIPLERVELAPYTADYFSDYSKIDIVLDTYPYPGGATTCDALYMGVPVITLAGNRHNARFGYSLLMNIGLAECCAFSVEEYVAKAVELAKDQARISAYRCRLRRRMQSSPLMDAGLYMAAIEAAYQNIWQQWLYGACDSAAARQAVTTDFQSLQESLAGKQWRSVIRAASRLAAMDTCSPQVLSAMGFAYLQSGDYARAVFWLRRALTIDKTNDVELYRMLGEALQDRLDYRGAYKAYDVAWSCLIKSQVRSTRQFRMELLLARAGRALGLGFTKQAAADYFAAYKEADDIKDVCEMYSSYLLCLHYGQRSREDIYTAHMYYKELFKGVVPYQHTVQVRNGKKLRVGYISPDFRQHVMFSFYYVLFACYDHDSFKVYCYSTAKDQDGFSEKIRSFADVWRDVSMCSYEETARQVYEDKIDILVDLAGHSAGSGLPVLAWKPAPVQISGLGYMDTTGLPAVDYLLTDAWIVPSAAVMPGRGGILEDAAYFTEKLLRLTTQFCYTGRNDVPVPGGAPCKKQGRVIFGVFNHYYKITDEMLMAWREILQRVPVSLLLLKSQVFVGKSAVELAYERLEKLGLPMERVLFEPATTDYMERYLDVDIALDTYPYPGGGTTCDALYMGVPVISLYGERPGSRFGLSILQNAGLGELAVNTLDQYIERAVALAGDPELLDGLHKNLRTLLADSPLMDARSYITEVENRYRETWQAYLHMR